jgi:putative transposase
MPNPRLTLIHYVFCPKYRKAAFNSLDVSFAVERNIRRIAGMKKIDIVEIAVQPDHVHVFCTLHRTLSVAQAAHLLKWFSSLYTRKQFPALTWVKADALWAQAYYSRSVTLEGSSQEVVTNYIRRQMRRPASDFGIF